jgi:hypothetical protein
MAVQELGPVGTILGQEDLDSRSGFASVNQVLARPFIAVGLSLSHLVILASVEK